MSSDTHELVRHAMAWQGIQVTPARQAIVVRLLDDLRTAGDSAQTRIAFDDSPADFERVLETFVARSTAPVT